MNLTCCIFIFCEIEVYSTDTHPLMQLQFVPGDKSAEKDKKKERFFLQTLKVSESVNAAFLWSGYKSAGCWFASTFNALLSF